MKLTHGPFPSPPKSPQTRSVVLPASEGGAEEGRLLARGQRLVLLQTEAEVAVAEKKREEGTSVFFCGHVVVDGLEFFFVGRVPYYDMHPLL